MLNRHETIQSAELPPLRVLMGGAIAFASGVPWHQAAGQCTISQLYVRNLMRDEGSSPLHDGFRRARGLQVSGGTEVVAASPASSQGPRV